MIKKLIMKIIKNSSQIKNLIRFILEKYWLQ